MSYIVAYYSPDRDYRLEEPRFEVISTIELVRQFCIERFFEKSKNDLLATISPLVLRKDYHLEGIFKIEKNLSLEEIFNVNA